MGAAGVKDGFTSQGIPAAPLTAGLLSETRETLSQSTCSAMDGSSVSQMRLRVSTVGCPKESFFREQRVALTPETVQLLCKKGYSVMVEKEAGTAAGFRDELYSAAGAFMVSAKEALEADVVLKVRAPSAEEIVLLKNNAIVYSFLFPAQNQETIDALAKKGVTCFAVDCVPRISRAQVFDALSSMANIAGYKAVVEAASRFGRFFAGQMTAAGRVPPAKILIIGGGVAGLSALASAKNMGAIVRCFDTRPAVKEQVESLGGEFLEVKGVEFQEGAGGYAKEMSKEFIDAEMALFADQAKQVDVIITTALIPGKPAPKLITAEMVASMRPGSIVVDLAAEQGGNCAMTVKDECITTSNGVIVIGFTDLPSRLPEQSSRLYSNNVTKLMLSMVDTSDSSSLSVNMEDEVTRGSLVLLAGTLVWPPPKALGPAPGAGMSKQVQSINIAKTVSPFRSTFGAAVTMSVGLSLLLAFNLMSHDVGFLSMLTIFALAGTAGYQAVWGVVPALHTPLMSVTNAISGITAVGGLISLSIANNPLSYVLSATAIVASFVNIFGGFVVTKRMLEMFKRPGDAKEHNYLYVIPGAVLLGTYFIAKQIYSDDISPLTYLAASLACIMAISGLASQKSARFGNTMGIMGIGVGIGCTLGLINLAWHQMLVAASLMAVGAFLGSFVGSFVQVTELPQTVAGFHSLVGLAAMVTSVAHFVTVSQSGEAAPVEKVGAIIGELIGGITLTGSIVAFCKLHGIMGSKALSLKGKNVLNVTLGLLQAAMIAAFVNPNLVMPGASIKAQNEYCLILMAVTAVNSLFLGYHLVASVGGGDMPVCITVLNSYSGWALVAEGFMLNNLMLTVVGSLIGFSGGILSYIMCVAMNRSLANVLFGGYATVAASKGGNALHREHREATIDEVVEAIVNARSVVVVPGYGMAVAKAQHTISELAKACRKHNVELKFAIHPVAGRMPGQMNVLLAEAGVPYDWVFEMDEINADFPECDVCLVVGANDITNCLAQDDPSCPIAGMPVLEVWKAKLCVFMKRSMAAGYADMDNPVFFKPNTLMLLGDAKSTTESLATKIKSYWEA